MSIVPPQFAQAQSYLRLKTVETPTRCGECPVRKQAVFRTIPDTLLDWAAQYRSKQQLIPSKQFLFTEGETAPCVYTIFSGWVKLTKTLHNGKSQVMRFGLPGDFLGFQSNLYGPMNYSVQALTEVTVCSFPRDKFSELFLKSPEVSSELAWMSARDMTLCHEHLLNAACKTAFQRVAHLLLELYYRARDPQMDDGGRIEVPITQEDIAESTGMTSVHVSRTLKQLREEQLIDCHRHQLVILNLEKITELTQFDPAILQRPVL